MLMFFGMKTTLLALFTLGSCRGRVQRVGRRIENAAR